MTPAQAAETSFDGTPVASTSVVVGGAVTHVDAAAAVSGVAVPTSTVVSIVKPAAALTTDSEHIAQKPVPKPIVVAPTAAGRANAGATRRAALQAAGPGARPGRRRRQRSRRLRPAGSGMISRHDDR